ncbi:efflux RND transporter periplasmic adaptor subunit [Thiomicrospira sp. WB1]|uniref:efflux RND transporter periplasmic adaptor subunit n=1 Tax=Thiomicrospira sp. WB1 TaxID=1685380 RepID=UPI0007469436|nr:HlyD family efflux transporter periplasmic adaptor subunit [Thiomicrospira sp. WB1]KUJ71167.1 secretion protein HlyD [Thiomicrospira sp. WB1]
MPNPLSARRVAQLKSIVWPVLIVLGAILIFVLLKATKPDAPQATVEEKVWPVSVLSLQRQALSPSQSLYGRVESEQMVTLASPVTGVVAERPLLAGEAFRKGERLLALDGVDLSVPLARAQAELADIEAQRSAQMLTQTANRKKLVREKKILALKETELARNQDLLKRDLVSESAVDQAREALARQEYAVVTARLAVEQHETTLAKLAAQQKRAKANVREAEMNRERGIVDAPFDGRVASVSVSPGDRVSAGATLMRFYDLNSLVLRARLPREHLKGLYRAQASETNVQATFETPDGEVFLPLIRLDGEASASGVDGFFALPAALTYLRPGDLLSATLHLPKHEGVFAVPYSALYGTDRVYVVEASRLQPRRVTLLGQTEQAGQTWALLQGEIKEGERLVTTHLPNAVGGLKVSIKENVASERSELGGRL